MEQLEKFCEIYVDEKHREVQFEIGGFWTTQEIEKPLNDMSRAAMTFISKGLAFHGLGKMEHIVPQTRETAEAIRDHLMMAKQHGLKRVAIVSPPMLMKLQYQRIAEGMTVNFFDSEIDAKKWLRAQPPEAPDA